MKYHENLFTMSQVIPCRQMDRHDEADSRFSQFCKCAKKLFTKRTGNHSKYYLDM
jgi:hypothetical protein